MCTIRTQPTTVAMFLRKAPTHLGIRQVGDAASGRMPGEMGRCGGSRAGHLSLMSMPSLPPGPKVKLREWILSSAEELHGLRDSLYTVLTGRERLAGRLDDVPESMVLVATELATNALRHGLPPTVVCLYRHAGTFVLDVTDHDSAVLPEFPEARSPDGGGMGLKLARQLALNIGWYVSDHTKHVWAILPGSGSGWYPDEAAST